ncbi:hypothetical protein MJM04_30690, partial [Salmonella enterica subsp. enterica serovar Cerro]|nr:hypothetical protein [Salmonella enterica subsp. enterica serovar Cerro]
EDRSMDVETISTGSLSLDIALGAGGLPMGRIVEIYGPESSGKRAMGLPWQVGMGAIFWGAVGLLLLTIFRVRYWMIANIPVSLRV